MIFWLDSALLHFLLSHFVCVFALKIFTKLEYPLIYMFMATKEKRILNAIFGPVILMFQKTIVGKMGWFLPNVILSKNGIFKK